MGLNQARRCLEDGGTSWRSDNWLSSSGFGAKVCYLWLSCLCWKEIRTVLFSLRYQRNIVTVGLVTMLCGITGYPSISQQYELWSCGVVVMTGAWNKAIVDSRFRRADVVVSHFEPYVRRRRIPAAAVCSKSIPLATAARYVKSWRHPQNRNYVIYRILVKKGPSQPWPYWQYNSKFDDFRRVVFEIYEQTNKQNNIQYTKHC